MDRAVNDEEVRRVLSESVGGQLSQKENEEWEFKESFSRKTFLDRYPKDLAGFANNKGGTMIFGVKDRPREPVGLNAQKVKEFHGLDHSHIENILSELFSGQIRFDSKVVTVDGKNFGVFCVFPSENKPIMAIKDDETKRDKDRRYLLQVQREDIQDPTSRDGSLIQERIQEVLMRLMPRTIKDPALLQLAPDYQTALRRTSSRVSGWA